MAANAPVTIYREEFIAAFEQHQALLRECVTTDGTVKGNSFVFDVIGSGGAEAKTRGINGLIPARNDDNTQVTCTLSEWHDLVEKTGFNIFQSQGNQRAAMQMTSVGVLNRKIDSQIITELNTGTLNTGSAATATLRLANHAKVILGNNDVPWDGDLYAAVTPAFEGYLNEIKEFGSAEYVNSKPLPGQEQSYRDRPNMFVWLGVKWVVHPSLPGSGTSAEKCFMWHKSALGHAADTAGMQTPIGYDDKQDLSWARATMYMGAKKLQNSGIVIMNHDGSAFAAA